MMLTELHILGASSSSKRDRTVGVIAAERLSADFVGYWTGTSTG
jgi:hypothetical protein